MIHRISEFITDSMFSGRTTSEKTKKIYVYCFEQIISQILFIITILLFGIINDVFWVSVLFLICIVPLRIFGGGAHAPTQKLCFFFSYGISILVIAIIPYVYTCISKTQYMIVFIICGLLIWYLSPVQHRNKPLSYSLSRKLHLKTTGFIVFLATLAVYFFIKEYILYLVTEVLSVIIVCTSSIIGHLENMREKTDGIKDGNM